MELHLHLSVAFRALDRKWGKAIDLDTSEVSLPCLPAVIDRPTTTFSSEEFLRKQYRAKSYSRVEERSQKENMKIDDSFANVSSPRIKLSEIDAKVTPLESSLDEDYRTAAISVEEFVKSHILEGEMGSMRTLDSALEEKKPVKILKQLKSRAKSYIDKKCRKIFKC